MNITYTKLEIMACLIVSIENYRLNFIVVDLCVINGRNCCDIGFSGKVKKTMVLPLCKKEKNTLTNLNPESYNVKGSIYFKLYFNLNT